MKFWIITLSLFAVALASLPSSEYLPPLEEGATNNVDLQTLSDTSSLADDGYHYKTVKRQRYRHRRDVSELPANEYLPPVAASNPEPAVIDLPVPEASQDSAVLADDGYRYKTVKRYRLRHRRDVSHLPANEYLPPAASEEAVAVAEAPVEVAPVEVAEASQDSAVLADDGYRYKTVKRYRLRHRRDVSHLPANEYLPPAASEEAVVVAEAPVEVAPVEVAEASQDSAVLADDGYRYKTVKRYRLRHRRDVSHLPANEYLPPAASEEAVSFAEAPVEVAPVEVAEASQDSAVLANDGYRYKTARRVVFRRRH